MASWLDDKIHEEKNNCCRRDRRWSQDEMYLLVRELAISKEQLDIITIASMGLRSRPHITLVDFSDTVALRNSFPRLCEAYWYDDVGRLIRGAAYLLYVALLGVGVEKTSLEEVGFDCSNTEIDREYLLSKYPKFSILLVVGDELMSSTNTQLSESCNLRYYNRESAFWDSCDSFWGDFKESIFYRTMNETMNSGYLEDYDELSARLSYYGWSKCYLDMYFDRLEEEHMPPSRAAAKRALQEGMEEGYVSLNNIKMVICGPPFVGKTAFKHLLLNKPPPLKHNSTPIAARPIQAIERIAAGDNTWEETNEEDLLHMLSNAIEKETIPGIVPNWYGIAATTPDQTNDEKDHNVPSSPHVDIPAKNSAPLALPAQKEFLPSTYKSYASLGAKAMKNDYVLKKIAEQLASSKERKGSQRLLEATWIHLLDSGGQPQFIDLLHMFMRDNSLYIIVMKVTESLHDKPMFVYSLNGSPLSVPQEITMTNLQIIESFVRSVAVASRYKTTKPAFAIVATNCDRSKFRRFVGLDEKLKTKNKVLQECLSEFLDLFIFYNHDSNELIFPVDNLCRWNRQKISTDIRSRLLCSRSDISFNVKIPIRWYVFDLNMKKEASTETHGIISLESCFDIGREFGMDKPEVKYCLNYLDSMRLCIYYPNIIPDVVFTSPQFLIDCLSNIVRVSFVDDLQQILPKGVSLSDETVQSLKRDGVFNELLLDSLGLTFLPSLFSKSNLLSLLRHFRLISPIKAACDVHQYFIPVLLPAERLTEEQKAIFGSSLDPLIITFKGQLVLQVSD